jgi:hypothetical protein
MVNEKLVIYWYFDSHQKTHHAKLDALSMHIRPKSLIVSVLHSHGQINLIWCSMKEEAIRSFCLPFRSQKLSHQLVFVMVISFVDDYFYYVHIYYWFLLNCMQCLQKKKKINIYIYRERCVMMLCKVKNSYYFEVGFNISKSQMVNLSCLIIFSYQNLMGY